MFLLIDTVKIVNSPKAAETIARETGAKIFTLDPITTGEAKIENLNDYQNKMRQNMKSLSEALQ
ncbi:MAG: zinc ABC transporter substrate-binding protein [Selenomonadaceae bacterium]|nr:zinc ABC transporter substrate-binding protein [Selenomonadaceae bacterium]